MEGKKISPVYLMVVVAMSYMEVIGVIGVIIVRSVVPV